MIEHVVTARDGRQLRVVEDGDGRGFPVFFLHGNPGSGHLFPLHVADARSKGIRLLGYDRPGYGGSTPSRGRTIADAAGDVASIADQLRLDRFAVWGHSAGGPPALACAALLPDRVVGATSLAAHAPYPAEGLDWLQGMGEFNQEDFRLMLRDLPAWEEKLQTDTAEMMRATPESITAVFSSLLSEVDRLGMTPELAQYFTHQIQHGLRNGPQGTRDDSLAEAKEWGFDFGAIRVPVQVWHGQHDLFSPIAHGRWIAARIPKAITHFEPGEGHVTLFGRRIPEVHDWLLRQA